MDESAPTTYAPNTIINIPDTFEWSDQGGRYLSLRYLPESGQLRVAVRAPALHDYGDDYLEADWEWDGAAFIVAKPDVRNFLSELERWCRS